MINPLVKIISVDDFFQREQAKNLADIVFNLNYEQVEFGEQVSNFNMIPENCNQMFSEILGTKIIVDEKNSGVFRRSIGTIHFESFESTNEWIFACAVQQSIFNVYEHHSGSLNALQGYNFNYKNLFEWDLKINYILEPGQGILFRPWLFHSFDQGIIQIFRLKEYEQTTS